MRATTAFSTTLENGDRLTLDEFNRRYCARPDLRHAELIEGVVHLPSPARIPQHADPLGLIAGWLAAFCALTTGVRLALGGTTRLSDESQVEPDAFLYRTGLGGAGFRITAENYGDGPPDLVVEVSASSASYDLHSKLRIYEQAGVPEYVVWRTEDRQVDWFRLTDGRYVRIEPDGDGIIASAVFPGLRLLVPALLAGDYAAVIGALAG
jgi:Uma2 family endonuclease